MAYLRLLGHHFDPVYLKSETLGRAVSLLYTPTTDTALDENRQAARRQQDRRCGVDRRRQQQPVLLDTRSPHARRQQSRRLNPNRMSGEDNDITGIDVYA